MSDLWQIVCSKYNFNIIAFVALLYEMTHVLCELYTEVCMRGFVIKETRNRLSRVQDWPGIEGSLVIYIVYSQTNALFINLVRSLKFTLKYTIISLLHVSVFDDHHQGALSVPN